MPASAAGRCDDIRLTLDLLRREQRRLERIGFELPLARCHAEVRYWSFLAALHALPADAGRGPARGGASCDARDVR